MEKNFNIDLIGNKLWAFLYNSCIHESSYATMSLHFSKEGAEQAMKEHKKQAKKIFDEMEIELEKYYTDETKKIAEEEDWYVFGEHEDWTIQQIDILP